MRPSRAPSLVVFLILSLTTVRADVIVTVAGGGPYPAGNAVLSVPLGAPHSVAVGGSGDIFIAAGNLNLVLKAVPSGQMSAVAGNGSPGFSGDGGPARLARLNNPDGVTLDAAGNLFISDLNNRRVRRVEAATGIITTVAGGGLNSLGDGGPATDAIVDPAGTIAVDAAGNLLIADFNSGRIRRVDAASGIITTAVGSGLIGFGGDGFPASIAQLNDPMSVALDAAGNLYFADSGNNRVRVVSAATGIINTVAGGGPCCDIGDGGLATAAFLRTPSGIALDASGNLFFADAYNRRLRRVDHATGIITTVAGTGTEGFGGDGGPAASALLSSFFGVAHDTTGSLFLADTGNNRVRRVDAGGGLITTVAGDGRMSAWGDGGFAPLSGLGVLAGLFMDGAGDLYIADVDNHNVRKIAAGTGIITTVAGSGASGFGGDGGPAIAARLRSPKAVAVDAAGNLFIADTGNSRIRRVDAATGGISTVAGTGANGFSGDGGPATAATFRSPSGVGVNASGDIFISDRINHRVRRVEGATGIITTIAGDGTSTGGDAHGPATKASIPDPLGLALDAAGNLFIADHSDGRIRRVDGGSGGIRTIAGGGGDFPGEGGPATSAQVLYPTGVTVDAAGDVFFADEYAHLVRRVEAAHGTINTVAGYLTPSCCDVGGFDGDGGPPTQAHLNAPFGVAVNATGDVLIADSLNHRIREAGVPACFDRDGDGFGLPGVPACPGGRQDDCDDANPARNPGHPEICDGLDNDCDGVVPANEADGDGDGVRVCAGDCDDANPGAIASPAAVGGMDIEEYNGGIFYYWTNQSTTAGAGTRYDVFSGSVSDLLPAGDFSGGSCLVDDFGGSYLNYRGSDPPPGQAIYFVIRAQNDCPGGGGTYGNAARDQSIALSPSSCP